MNSSKEIIKSVFLRTIPILCGYVCLGIGFGVLLSKSGYSFIWSLFSSVFIYAGSMQFVEVDLLNNSFNLISAIILTIAVNVRHIFYGLSIIEKYRDLGKYKLYCIFGLSDETYSLVCSPSIPDVKDKPKYYFLTTFFNQIYWIVGCTIGGIIGQYIDFNANGIGFVMTALFVVIFLEQWESTNFHTPALIGVGCSFLSLLLCKTFFAEGEKFFLIPSLVLIFLCLTIGKNSIERRLKQ